MIKEIKDKKRVSYLAMWVTFCFGVMFVLGVITQFTMLFMVSFIILITGMTTIVLARISILEEELLDVEQKTILLVTELTSKVIVQEEIKQLQNGGVTNGRGKR